MAELLDTIDGPEDLKGLDDAQLAQVAQEVRELIIETIGEIGGHFGANLGTCEIAVALHSLLESPKDKILWDVGHQAYPHKVLTGRRDQLGTIRKYEGLAPFCSIGESEHDIMGAGHASTSVSYAVGLKEAMRQGRGEDGKVVAVIGDGALTGGVAYEALHHAGGMGLPIVILLNDNGMSIAPNVGALNRYFNRARMNPKLYHAREGVENRITRLPAGIGDRIERLGPIVKESLKAYWAPGLLFEELDLAYMGVIDGHDVTRRARGAEGGARRRPPGGRALLDGEGQGLRAGRGGRPGGHGEVACRQARLDRERRTRGQARGAGQGPQPGPRPVHEGVRRRARGRGRARRARDRHHRRHELGHRPGHPPEGDARPLLRRGHRRAARHPVRRRPGAPGRQARGGDLLDLPPARVRPDRARRVPAEPGRGVRHGPRRAGGRRRADPSRRVRHLLPARAAEHGARRAARRGPAGAPAAHRARPRGPVRRCATRAAPPRACRCPRSPRCCRSAAASCCARASAWRCWATATACRSRSAPPTCWPPSTAWSPRWPTPASPSRWTPS